MQGRLNRPIINTKLNELTGLIQVLSIISNESITNIKAAAGEIERCLKENKFINSSFSRNVRLNKSEELFVVNRMLSSDEECYSIIAPTDDSLIKLTELVKTLNQLLQTDFTARFDLFKIKDYASDIVKVKLCRELVSSLEDLYILGVIKMSDVKDVYETLKKPLPKKYAKPEMTSSAEKVVYSAIKNAIKEDAEHIKTNSIIHYKEMVSLIDPNDEFKNTKDFFSAGRKKISDIEALKLCIACKFDYENFLKLIDDNFVNCVSYAASKVADQHRGDEKPVIKVNSTKVGGKGFDVSLELDSRSLYVRAIPVKGFYVRFHYRYIIT